MNKLLCSIVTFLILVSSVHAETTASTVINQSPKASVMTGFAVAVQNAIIPQPSFYQSRDCQDAARVYNTNPDSIIVYETMNVAAAAAKGMNCQINFGPQEVVLSTVQHFQFCKKVDSDVTLSTAKTLGMSGMHPYELWIKDFNTKNNRALTVSVYQGSGATLRGVVSGEIDYGFIADAVAEKGQADGLIKCDYSTDLAASNYIGKQIKHTLPDLNIKVVVLARRNQAAVRETLSSVSFREYLSKSGYTNTKSHFTAKELTNFQTQYNTLRGFY